MRRNWRGCNLCMFNNMDLKLDLELLEKIKQNITLLSA